MTEQEVFDKVAAHLLSQGKRAFGKVGCMYRGPDGTKCAIGCLISDKDYKPEMEGKTATGVRHLYPGVIPNVDLQLLRYLQSLHDVTDPRKWDIGLYKIAQDRGLKYKGKAYTID